MGDRRGFTGVEDPERDVLLVFDEGRMAGQCESPVGELHLVRVDPRSPRR